MVQMYFKNLSVLRQELQARISFQDIKAFVTDANIKECFGCMIPI